MRDISGVKDIQNPEKNIHGYACNIPFVRKLEDPIGEKEVVLRRFSG